MQSNNGWNLIETAPTDGTEILVYSEDTDKIYKASYLDINDNHFKPKVRADVYTSCMYWVVPESYKDSSYYVIVDPSHWRPLPTKPHPLLNESTLLKAKPGDRVKCLYGNSGNKFWRHLLETYPTIDKIKYDSLSGYCQFTFKEDNYTDNYFYENDFEIYLL